VLCIENKLDCELDGVRTSFVADGTGDECGRVIGNKVGVRDEGVVPYG